MADISVSDIHNSSLSVMLIPSKGLRCLFSVKMTGSLTIKTGGKSFTGTTFTIRWSLKLPNELIKQGEVKINYWNITCDLVFYLPTTVNMRFLALGQGVSSSLN